MHTILITGSNGLLGQKLLNYYATQANVRIIATSSGENRYTGSSSNITYCSLDITNQPQVALVLERYSPNSIIHTAAMTNVDECELNTEKCHAINVLGTQHLVEYCARYLPNTHFTHLSTDFIFDGTCGPYDESATPNPLSSYAQSKLDAEHIVLNSILTAAILRTVLVYGITPNMSRSNVVLWVKKSLEENKNINVVTDQARTPTLAEDLAQGCALAEKHRAVGVYNISGKDFMNIYELAVRVAKYFKLDEQLITPSTSQGIQQPAKRPPVTGFIITKAINELGYAPHSFEEGLHIMEQQLQQTVN
ncbi:MAG: SDR family oxidoreductase [Bacteroidia bacterium]|nr:SDR family oxidoreductase [Bacteroidia bacterium]